MANIPVSCEASESPLERRKLKNAPVEEWVWISVNSIYCVEDETVWICGEDVFDGVNPLLNGTFVRAFKHRREAGFSIDLSGVPRDYAFPVFEEPPLEPLRVCSALVDGVVVS